MGAHAHRAARHAKNSGDVAAQWADAYRKHSGAHWGTLWGRGSIRSVGEPWGSQRQVSSLVKRSTPQEQVHHTRARHDEATFVAVVEPHCTKNPRCDSALFVMRLEPVARADSPPLPMYLAAGVSGSTAPDTTAQLRAYRISRISAICFFTNCRRWACSVAREFSARPRGLEGEIGPWDREPEPLLDMDTPWGLPPEPLPALRGDEADTPGEEPGELNPTDT